MNLISRILKVTSVLLLLFCGAGCVSGLLTLKRYADSQEEIERYVQKQEEGFRQLKLDAEQGALEKGMRKKRLIAKYGDPVLCAEQRDVNNPQVHERCLYRNPTDYFSKDKVYLYFDYKEKLLSWKVTAEEE